jgi:multiple antibiotic resistance protein
MDLRAAIPEFAKTIFVFFAALFPIVNPLGGATLFFGMTSGYTSEVRSALARKVAIYGFFLLLASMFLGSHVLHFFGISLEAVQVGGGLVVAATGWAMLNKEEDSRARDASRHAQDQDWERHAFYPLTLPLTVGPGSISVALTLGANLPHAFGPHRGLDWASVVAALIGISAISALVWICYASAERLSRWLGATGLSVVVRLSAFILLCIGVQILWNGLSVMLGTIAR